MSFDAKKNQSVVREQATFKRVEEVRGCCEFRSFLLKYSLKKSGAKADLTHNHCRVGLVMQIINPSQVRLGRGQGIQVWLGQI